MTEHSLKQIKNIVAAFSCIDKEIFFGGENTGIQLPENNQMKLFIQSVSEIIYDNCYNRHQFSFQKNSSTAIIGSEIAHSDFFKKHKMANHTSDVLAKGWVAEDVSDTQAVFAAKKEYRIISNAGNYLKSKYNASTLKQGEAVTLQLFSEAWQPGDHFYFISGQQQHDWWNSGSVRFYLNLKPDGAAMLMEMVSKKFNSFGIPFGFKCLVAPELYDRCDNSVLYVANCYLHIGIKIIREIITSLQKYFNDAVPLFTLKLSNGLSFAENPPWNNVSFGQSRCNIIARGLLKIWNESVLEKEISEIMRQTILENHLNPEKFYLNPRSAYEYDFSNFSF